MGRLTTHVLDTANGRPAAGMPWRLSRAGLLLASGHTTADGRTQAALLEGAAMSAGVYELAFDTAAYFRAQGTPLSDPPFLDTVTLRFGIADAEAHYHVPLLVSPWSYSSYRGS